MDRASTLAWRLASDSVLHQPSQLGSWRRIRKTQCSTLLSVANKGAKRSLTQGAFVLMGGRIGAVYGHKNTVVVAGAFWVLFHLISGFMKSVVTLSLMRGLSGIGGAFIVPNAIALLTVTFLPGKMRNITVGFFGTTTPVGAALGSLLAGLFVQLTPWKWLFFFL